MDYIKQELKLLQGRVAEPRHFIQVILGPRQVGKTTVVRQLLKNLNEMPFHFAAADGVPSSNFNWIDQQWQIIRQKLRTENATDALLVIDEIQKIDNWAEIVKSNWDADTFAQLNIKVILLGSARLLLQQGLTESLSGRFETIYMNHWSLKEMKDAFGYSAEEYVWFGGYPGAAIFSEDEERWKSYVIDSLAETTISKDILMLSRVDKPALLKRLFELGSAYSGQILSITKIMGQMQDAGNTTTLSHYVELLDSAGMLSGLPKYTPDLARQRASIPKWQVQNMAYQSAYSNLNFNEILTNPAQWGRHVESTIGTHLIRGVKKDKIELYYWREKNDEMDFVMVKNNKVIGLEVKSGNIIKADRTKAFVNQIHPDKVYLIGTGGMPWEEFLCIEPKEFF